MTIKWIKFRGDPSAKLGEGLHIQDSTKHNSPTGGLLFVYKGMLFQSG